MTAEVTASSSRASLTLVIEFIRRFPPLPSYFKTPSTLPGRPACLIYGLPLMRLPRAPSSGLYAPHLSLLGRDSILTQPRRRPILTDCLTTTQYFLDQPLESRAHNRSQATWICVQQELDPYSLDTAGRLDGVKSLDGADEGLALLQDSLGS